MSIGSPWFRSPFLQDRCAPFSPFDIRRWQVENRRVMQGKFSAFREVSGQVSGVKFKPESFTLSKSPVQSYVAFSV